MYRGDGIEARIISFGVGGGVLFIIEPMLALLVSEGAVYFCLLALSYTFFAAVVAYIWPQLGWRTGLWFFVGFPFVVLAAFLFSDPPPRPNWRAELTGLLAYAGSGLVGACFGGWLGAMISTRRRRKLNTAPPSDAQ
jgi:uncharacterized membrane protein YfcA